MSDHARSGGIGGILPLARDAELQKKRCDRREKQHQHRCKPATFTVVVSGAAEPKPHARQVGNCAGNGRSDGTDQDVVVPNVREFVGDDAFQFIVSHQLDEPLRDCLAEVISRQGGSQYHTAETEKYAHVTYFLNGGQEAAFPGEERLLIPSPKVATYDLAPEMSAAAVAQAVVDRVSGKQDSFVVVNFANPDMVGHTGVFPATVRAVEVVDELLGKIAATALARGRLLAITADHGNAELKVDSKSGWPLTAHTTSPVPLIMAGAPRSTRLRDGGKLADIAPTLLRLAGIPVPAAMTGDDLGG